MPDLWEKTGERLLTQFFNRFGKTRIYAWSLNKVLAMYEGFNASEALRGFSVKIAF